MKNSSKQTPFRLIFSYARKYWIALVVTVLSAFLLVGVQLLIPWIIKTLISSVTDNASAQQTLGVIGQLTIVVLAVYVGRAGLTFLRSYMAHLAGWGVVADVRLFIYEHLQHLSLRFYEDKQTGQLMSRVINDTDLFEQLIAHAAPDMLVNVITLFGVLAVLLALNWRLTLLSAAPIPLVIVSLFVYAKYVRPAFRIRQVELGNLNAILNDSISGIREIKAFTREDLQMQRVSVGIDRYRRSLMRALRLMAAFQPFVDFTSSIGQLVVIYFGGMLTFQHVLPVSDLVAFFLYLDLFYQPIRNLSNAWEQFQGALAGADRVAGLMEQAPEIDADQGAKSLKKSAEGNISFNNVSFWYNEGETVLEHITLDIPAKNVVALVGPTGVGKSTFVSLISRFYDTCSGSITLDGEDVRNIKLESLRQQISFVLQDVFLFHGTVRENILFGRPDASEEEMIAAAKIANAHDFIIAMAAGYETLIGERGIKLSGGQKQRLSIARAVLKNAPILILDEATSSVDTETELLIQEALERLMVGRTTIVIAHRLSTIRNANTIVVLEGRGIKEMGTHDELIAKNGLYHRLYNVQKRLDPHEGMANAVPESLVN